MLMLCFVYARLAVGQRRSGQTPFKSTALHDCFLCKFREMSPPDCSQYVLERGHITEHLAENKSSASREAGTAGVSRRLGLN
jgi:hypothetical protein